MTISPEVSYLSKQIANHVLLFYTAEAKNLIDSGIIHFCPYDKAVRTTGSVVAIPTDLPVARTPEKPFKVEFNNTELTLWNRVPPPSIGAWKAIPDESSPLWYQNQDGALIPAWNLFGNLFQLLTFDEESGSSQKDKHGRFSASYSPRISFDLLEVPAFNEAVAALIAAGAGLRANGRPSYNLDGLLKPPAVVLSHDCDILLGDDIWTQSVRGFRIFQPLTKMRLPDVGRFWWILRNIVAPRRFFFDNATGMIDLEKCFGYASTFYIINGSGGRFGARSGNDIVRKLLRKIPSGFDIGMHYNYDTFLDDSRFEAQSAELKEMMNAGIVAGRAHYLRFDPMKSFSFLRKFGILIDESSGYADRIGYRNGIAGCFQAYDTGHRKPLDIWEIPLTIMDAVFVNQYGGESISKFSRLLFHLSRIGGALSIVFHPEQFFNPEHKQMRGIYHRMLIECRKLQAVSVTARALVDKIR